MLTPWASRAGVAQLPAQGHALAAITLGPPHQLFHFRQPDALGLFNVPDMHTALLEQADHSYLLWITGNIGPVAGAVARLSTKDFITFKNAGPGSAKTAAAVFQPSCRAPAEPAGARGRGKGRATAGRNQAPVVDCLQNVDADYVGANTVLRAANGRDLLMFYEAGNKTAGSTTIDHGWEFNVMALARSSDDGVTWARQGAVVSGADPKPAARTRIAQPGVSEPGVIAADGFLYMFFQYIPNQSSDGSPSIIQAARAPIDSDGAPGAWKKYFNGSLTDVGGRGSFSEPGLGGKGSPIFSTIGSGCTRPVEVWPARSTYLNAYLLTYLCNEGWFFSTSTDLVNWTAPTGFMAMPMFQNCQPMDWNFMMVTPGNPAGVIGQTGYVLYAHSDSKGLGCGKFSPHMLASRTFEFRLARTEVPPRGVPPSEQNSGRR